MVNEQVVKEIEALHVGLREYLEIRLKLLNEQTSLALESLNARLVIMNEFRASLIDMISHLATKDALEALCNKFEQLIANLDSKQALELRRLEERIMGEIKRIDSRHHDEIVRINTELGKSIIFQTAVSAKADQRSVTIFGVMSGMSLLIAIIGLIVTVVTTLNH
jgi:hypothetical protein